MPERGRQSGSKLVRPRQPLHSTSINEGVGTRVLPWARNPTKGPRVRESPTCSTRRSGCSLSKGTPVERGRGPNERPKMLSQRNGRSEPDLFRDAIDVTIDAQIPYARPSSKLDFLQQGIRTDTAAYHDGRSGFEPPRDLAQQLELRAFALHVVQDAHHLCPIECGTECPRPVSDLPSRQGTRDADLLDFIPSVSRPVGRSWPRLTSAHVALC